jgi:hypothetical protein
MELRTNGIGRGWLKSRLLAHNDQQQADQDGDPDLCSGVVLADAEERLEAEALFDQL